MDEKIEPKPKVEQDAVFHRIGFHVIETQAGFLVFFRAYQKMTVSHEGMRKLGLEVESGKDTFLEGANAGLEFNGKLVLLANEFCGQLVDSLYKQNFSVGFVDRGQQKFEDKVIGPGVVVTWVRIVGGRVEDSKPKEVFKEAVEIVTSAEFSKDGVTSEVEALEYGVLAGGPLKKAYDEDPEGLKNRAFMEELGLGHDYGTIHTREFNDMRSRVQVVWENYLREKISPGQEGFKEECEKLMKDLMRKLIFIERRHDDGELWRIIEDEISMACATYGRMSQERRWEIFRRVRVRLGLEAD